MSDPFFDRPTPAVPSRASVASYPQGSSANLADILERVLDKGIVIAGDIRINLLDIELLTIKLRLLIASVDKAKEMGIDWWEHDPALSSRHVSRAERGSLDGTGRSRDAREDTGRLEEENRRLRAELAALRRERPAVGPAEGTDPGLPEEEASPDRAARSRRAAP
ncbi:gas vesicle protein GvpJ [Streptomyces sp. NRRL S-87]|uniref:gas vesicle protein GvpJ n=1 Tax=Streptomyces sp. NRRL S-87 TaxID=1463920 RepID=UPI00055B7D7E|nr:gas vesicle protein GvpJ [Streptomyces sp. NRRL S-87]